MIRYKLKDIYSLCGLFPNDFKVYNEYDSVGITYIPLKAVVIAFQQVSNKRYEILAITDCFVFYNDEISPRDSRRMAPEIMANYILTNIPNKLSDYLKFFRDNFQYVEKAYKEYLITQKLNNISEDFL